MRVVYTSYNGKNGGDNDGTPGSMVVEKNLKRSSEDSLDGRRGERCD